MEDEILEQHFCEDCGKSFPLEDLQAENIFGPVFCETCLELAQEETENYEYLDNWLNKNK